MSSYRRINSRTINRDVQQQDNMVIFNKPISKAIYPNYFSVPDASDTSLLVSNGSAYSASAASNLTFNGTALNVTGTLQVSGSVANPIGVVGSSFTSKTQITNGFTGALTKNTYYLAPPDRNSIIATLPTAASSTVGDAIIIEYTIDISNGQTHKYGTSGEFFMANSSCYRPNASIGYSVNLANGTTHDFLNLIGLTDAGPGVGSYVIFTFNGTMWRAEARCTSSATGITVAAGTSVFATS
jgi:hypothetical protein